MPNLMNSSSRPLRSRPPFSLQDVRDTFDYCAETGNLYYKGTETIVTAHQIRRTYYLRIANKQVSVHRLCWYIYYGEWPAFNLRHLNGDTTDNRIANLARARWENDRSRARYKADADTSRGDLAAATQEAIDAAPGAEHYPPVNSDLPRW